MTLQSTDSAIVIDSEADVDISSSQASPSKDNIALSEHNVITVLDTPQRSTQCDSLLKSFSTPLVSGSEDVLPSPRDALNITNKKSVTDNLLLSLTSSNQSTNTNLNPSSRVEIINLNSSPPNSLSSQPKHQEFHLFHTPTIPRTTQLSSKTSSPIVIPDDNEQVASPLSKKAASLTSSPLKDFQSSPPLSTVLQKSHSLHDILLDTNDDDHFPFTQSPLTKTKSFNDALTSSSSILKPCMPSIASPTSNRLSHAPSTPNLFPNQDSSNTIDLINNRSKTSVENQERTFNLTSDVHLDSPTSPSKHSSIEPNTSQEDSFQELPSLNKLSIQSRAFKKMRLPKISRTTDTPPASTSNSNKKNLDKLKKMRKLCSRSLEPYELDSNTQRKRKRYEDSLKKSKTLDKVDSLNRKMAKELDRKNSKELQKINKVKRTKEECLSEIILLSPDDWASSWYSTVRSQLDSYNCQFVVNSNQPKDSIMWKRKVNNVFNSSTNRFELSIEHEQIEPFALLRLKCRDFIKYIEEDQADTFFHEMSEKFKGCKLILLLEGIPNYFKSLKAELNRQYAAAVNSGTRPLLFGSLSKYQNFTKEKLESEIVRFSFEHSILINTSNDEKETAQWIVSFTGDIALSRYKHFSKFSARASTTEIGHVKSADRIENSLNFMLRQILRVTPNIANAICDQFDSIPSLIHHLKTHGEESLTNVVIQSSISERNLGPVLSRRIYNTFLCKEASSDAP
ncbi:Holliday junction resolvase subunit Eme1 [Schizosaccharomyces pombe]|uniref:Crossover junction endonuclease eme1 n=1 Tax=Schizosaccharomyces pombe (strain 972 / ATCC 24843) TaxID=284812 RepID=EME1_SCHPO|nr:Holliday junction resolvase subunit Eme1 [Schizosaccharomyces pombe]Q9C103.2 RecName: Full=Crossover junction endonuclease eme1; AltName: Full=Essential meiotic endonuclease 1 [Schizosaccharomyces pombe 972h-]CAC36923.2 Holliday junction resolvase subunit Eme1 [Schizosaccharomyces pombe]|eukprot:NP_594132.2 Holliday junction resolvase subunit Eme1 [Schizosaccharomyces pombe]